MTLMTKSGLLLVLEGVEGVGKTTQWERLGALLRADGHDVLAVREPGGTKTGDLLRQLLLDPAVTLSDAGEALLFASSRAEIIAQVIQPALDRGAVVLLDRFLLSTYAYQGAGRGLDIKTLNEINRVATRGIRPDVTLLLTMSLDVALQRANARSSADRIEREGRDFHQRVSSAFMAFADNAWQQSHPECGPIVVIDAGDSAETVTRRCLSELSTRWPNRFGSNLV